MTARPTLFFLHGLGCSARTWDHLVRELSGEFDCVALDLPGHGAAADSDQLTVEQMVDVVVAELIVRRPATWTLVGHSMGGKLATIVTAQAERRIIGLTRPFALVLVAASPLGPEPMDEDTRQKMIGWGVDGRLSEPAAQEFIAANTASELPADRLAAAVADVQRVNPTAWLAWLERGSREDWSGTVDRVRVPTLVVAGADDGPLGVGGQRDFVLPGVGADDVVVVAGAAHLIALEQTEQLAQLISEHLHQTLDPRAELPTTYLELIDSDRVSARTRAVLLGRLPEPPAGSGILGDGRRALLTALLARVVPQRGTSIDLAARIDAQLASAASDGWRFAQLPPDVEAWRRGLDTLAAQNFVELGDADQEHWIEAMIGGEVGSDDPAHLTAEQMTLWFEDVRAEAVRTYLAHPAALARIGYDGFANGGDGRRKQGYLRTGADDREPWQAELPQHRPTPSEPTSA